jgi:2-methylcitrate dehydratase PrpD
MHSGDAEMLAADARRMHALGAGEPAALLEAAYALRTAGSFEEDQLDDPQVLEMSSRVDYEVVEYAEYPESFPGGVRVVLRDGSVHEEHLRHNIGSVNNPMTRSAVHDKFLDGATRVAGTQDATELLACLEDLARQESTEGFSAAMSKTTTSLESAGN